MIRRWRHALWQTWLGTLAASGDKSLRFRCTCASLSLLARLPVLRFRCQYLLGQAFAAVASTAAAARCFEAAIATGRVSDPGVYHQLGMALKELSRDEDAEHWFRQSIAHKPGAWWSHRELGELMCRQERWSEAEEEFTQALAIDHSDDWTHFHLLEAQLARLPRECALEHWMDRVLAAPPLAALHLSRGSWWADEAAYTPLHADKLGEVARRYPDCEGVNFLLGCMLNQLGRARESAAIFQRFNATAWTRTHDTPPANPGQGKDPEFLVLGMGKGGSTALYHYLTDHPLVCPAIVKEVDFFHKFHDFGIDWYRSCFMPIPAGAPQITGEASVGYFWHPEAPGRVAAFRPDMKLLLVIRDPVARAWSDYHMRRQLALDVPDWEILVDRQLAQYPRCPLDIDELPDGFPREELLVKSAALPFLKRWLRHFPPQQMLVVDNAELARDVVATMAGVYRFLGLPPHTPASTERQNVGAYPPLAADMKERLRHWYEPHQQALARFLATELA